MIELGGQSPVSGLGGMGRDLGDLQFIFIEVDPEMLGRHYLPFKAGVLDLVLTEIVLGLRIWAEHGDQ